MNLRIISSFFKLFQKIFLSVMELFLMRSNYLIKIRGVSSNLTSQIKQKNKNSIKLENLPVYISLLFGITAVGAVLWFYFVTRSKSFLVLALCWMVLQSIMGYSSFYQNTETIPPRMMIFGILPALTLVLFPFFTKKGKTFIQQINLKKLTYFHSIRIAVEITLGLLFYYRVVSVYMTLEGTNFDLVSGITAPIIAYLAYKKCETNKKLLFGWNIVCLLLLLNVVVTAILAFPSPFQKLAFNQPNLAILYFPFNLLPTVVVPIVLFSHLAALKKLTFKNKTA